MRVLEQNIVTLMFMSGCSTADRTFRKFLRDALETEEGRTVSAALDGKHNESHCESHCESDCESHCGLPVCLDLATDWLTGSF